MWRTSCVLHHKVLVSYAPLREALRLGKVSFGILFEELSQQRKRNTDNLKSLLMQGTVGCVALIEPDKQHTM